MVPSGRQFGNVYQKSQNVYIFNPERLLVEINQGKQSDIHKDPMNKSIFTELHDKENPGRKYSTIGKWLNFRIFLLDYYADIKNPIMKETLTTKLCLIH